MAISSVITIWVLVKIAASEKGMPTAGHNLGKTQELKSLLQRVDPWKIVNSSNTVYIAKASWKNSSSSDRYCVSSDYLWYDAANKTTYRNLKFSALRVSSLNMSLQVKRAEQLGDSTLLVHLLYNIYNILPSINPEDFAAFDQYSFPVLYGDNKCLILANPAVNGRPYIGCTMWVTERKSRPPFCCDFLYFLLCGETKATNFDNTKCGLATAETGATVQS
uniref:Lipocalin/cytosolic fatty-acid binding domain-containing protein n=1 Tax=Amblyomma maculatum TaxID=34609 RepID=G3ML14_AMBMU